MKKVHILKSSFRMMGRFKMRTFFMMTGILVGIMALTMIFSIGMGTEKKVMDNINRMFNSSSIMIMAGGGGMMGGMQQGTQVKLTIEDIKVLGEEIPNINYWDPMQLTAGKEVKYKTNSVSSRIWAYGSQAEIVWNRGVSEGEFFDESHLESMARVALIGQKTAQELFGDEDPIGKQVRIETSPYRVIGILDLMGTDPHGMDRDSELYIPITTAMRRLMNVDSIMSAQLLLKDPKEMDQTVSRINEILRQRHHIQSGEKDDYSIFTPVEVREMVSSANKIFNLFLPLIAAISLLVGGIVASNLMLISVNERKGEIGLRRAVGAKSKDVLFQFLMETTVITIIGGLFGIILGTAGVQVIARLMDIPQVLSWKAVVLGLCFSSLVGLVSGIFPARRAASLQPVDALR